MLREDLKYITIEHLRDTNQISVRTANCCISIGLNTLYEIVSCFEDIGSFLKKKMKNAGHKTCEELDKLCANIIPQIEKEKQYAEIKEVAEIISEQTEQGREILLLIANLIIEAEDIIKEKKRIFEKDCTNDFSFAVEFYTRNGHFPMFWILEQQLVVNKNRSIEILIDAFPVFQNYQPQTLDKIAIKHNLTRERVRQVRNDAFRRTFEITDEVVEYKRDRDLIKYAELLQKRDDWEYVIDFLKNERGVSHNDSVIQSLLDKEQCNLSPQFVLQVVVNIYKDKYYLIGGFEVSEKNKTWENTFLIKKELIDAFDFTRLKGEFELLLMNNTSDYFLDISNHIEDSQCWIKFDFNKIDSIVSTSKNILLHELGLSTEDLDGYLKIPANKERNPIAVLYDILREKGEPMPIEDIFIEFKKVFPFHKYTEANQLRPYLYKNEAITHRNRSSIYTLKEWKHIKTGTIRDAIVEFLINNDFPQTVEDITQEILQHFPDTNLASVKATMFSDPKKRFSFFGDNLFGLRNKQYPSEYEEIEQQEKQRKSTEQRLTNLEKFLVENEHFPFSSSKDKEEESLNRWWSRIIKDLQPLNEKQQFEVNRIKKQYADLESNKATYEWYLNCNKVKLFFLENRRYPFTTGAEKHLSDWFKKACENFEKSELCEKQRQKFIELTVLILHVTK